MCQFKTIRPLDALSSGVDLWILPDLLHSIWMKKIDWYLNFQTIRANQRCHPPLLPPLKEIVDELDLDIKDIDTSNNMPLMISSYLFLPNLRTISLPSGNQDCFGWIQKVANIWNNLQRPSLRVFLPQYMADIDVQQNWTMQGKETIELVLSL